MDNISNDNYQSSDTAIKTEEYRLAWTVYVRQILI